jgi:hypothetical protein
MFLLNSLVEATAGLVFLDEHIWRGRRMAHLGADSLAELHAFARRMRCRRRYFHDKPGLPHYDLIGPCIEEALRLGAEKISSRAFVLRCRAIYDNGGA